jgi:5S rRNA maturation endonuclease (ribonuclease M5)
MELKYFESYLEQLYDDGKIDTMFPDQKGNVKLCCPFKHKRTVLDNETWEEKEEEYYEVVPSSSINLNMRVFHCFTCDRTYKELEFAQAITGKSKEELLKEHVAIETLKSANETWAENQHKSLLENENVLDKLNALKITKEAIEELNLGYMTNCLATPIFKNGNLINIARYNINKDPNYPKVRYNENTNTGDIVPFDVWKKDFRPTVVCEGEKDMIVARSNGFNAITLTGGSQSSVQAEYFDYFKDRDVYICYDNDDAGLRGAKKLYKDLQRHCKNVYVVDISKVCTENKEDVTDFFVKYDKNHDDFKELLLNNSKKLTDEDLKEVKTKHEIPLSKIEENIEKSNFGKTLKSTLQIIATCTETYSAPEYAVFKPIDSDEDVKPKAWYIDSSRENFLELIEGKVVKGQIPDIIASQIGLGSKWQKAFSCELGNLQTIYKVSVTDVANENDEKASEFTIDIYSKQPLEIGNIYEITYKLYPHPKQGRKTIAVAEKIEETNYEFDVNNEDYIQSLKKFKAEGYIGNKINELYESARCHIAPYLNKDLWFLMDLVFNSPLDIVYNKSIRGALDVFVLGDTRTGKSETSRALKELYDFGEVVPLKTSTVASLIGGTDDKLKRTKLGVLPRYHKELVVMEEFSGAPLDFIKTLTEIRSSSMVKIYRVAGDIQAPCKIRMITISNPISENNNLMSLSNFPNGVEPINELIKSPEDIARYDAFILVPRVEKLSNPFSTETKDEYKIEKEAYRHKSKWIKSLTDENVKISDELGSYIFEQSLKLNEMFESSFTLFGSETDKKIARMSSALACMLCSTNDYKHIIVTKEHVDYIVEFIKHLYDNDIFRLKEFADEEKSYNVVVDEDTKQLETLYPKNVTFIDFLANTSKVNRNELQTVSGLSRDDFTKIFNLLVSRKFIKLSRDSVAPTVKFRNTYRLINKNFNLSDTSQLDENLDVFG